MGAGKNGKLYGNLTGTNAIPVWTEFVEVRDLDIPSSPDKIEESDRECDFKTYTDGLIDLGINFNMTFRNGNLNCAVIRDALTAGTAIQFAAMDGDITTVGNEGWMFYSKVFKNDQSQPLTDGNTVDIELAPTYFQEVAVTIQPSFFVVP